MSHGAKRTLDYLLSKILLRFFFEQDYFLPDDMLILYFIRKQKTNIYFQLFLQLEGHFFSLESDHFM